MLETLVPQRGGLRRRRPRAGTLEEFEDIIGRLWETGEEGLPFGEALPSLDISETDKSVEVRLDLPGVKPKEIDIRLNGNLLTIRGERREEREEKGKTYHRVERRAGAFSRSITLPCAIQEDEGAAEYHDGVLTITLPKTEEAKTRKIAVKS